MRAIREQPRLAFARMIGVVCLLAVGIAIGAAVRGEDRSATRAAEVRLVSAQRSARDKAAQLQSVRAQLAVAVAARNRDARALRTQRRVNKRLRRELAAAKRKRHKAKSKARGQEATTFIRALITMLAADAVDRHMREQQHRAWLAEYEARAAAAAAPPLPGNDPARPERPA